MPQAFKMIGKISIKLFGIRKHKPRKKPKPKPEKQPSLLMSKLHAEHEKICPPIYFVEKINEDHLK